MLVGAALRHPHRRPRAGRPDRPGAAGRALRRQPRAAARGAEDAGERGAGRLPPAPRVLRGRAERGRPAGGLPAARPARGRGHPRGRADSRRRTTWRRSRTSPHEVDLAADGGDVIAMTSANRRFHFALFDAAGMPRLSRLLRQLWEATDAYRALYFQAPAQPRPGGRRACARCSRRCATRDAEALVTLHDRHRDNSVDAVRAHPGGPPRPRLDTIWQDWIQSPHDPLPTAPTHRRTHDHHAAVARSGCSRSTTCCREEERAIRDVVREYVDSRDQAERGRLVRGRADPGARARQGARHAGRPRACTSRATAARARRRSPTDSPASSSRPATRASGRWSACRGPWRCTRSTRSAPRSRSRSGCPAWRPATPSAASA